MASKWITIFLVPDGENKVRQFRIPSFLPVFLILLFISCAALLFLFIRDYRSIKPQMPRFARLEKDNELQKQQLVYLAQRIDETTQKMCELRELDRKLKEMTNFETSEDGQEFQGVGGSDPTVIKSQLSAAKTPKELVRSMHRSLDELDSEIALCEENKAYLHKVLKNQEVIVASTPSIWPTKGWLSSRFGYRISPFTGKREFHRGIDISTRMGAPVIAPADGLVSRVYWDRGYGKVLCVNHGSGVMTKYAHLKKALVRKGQYVERGEKIALVGKTGRTTGPHLHYEVHLNKVPVNPLRYILN